MGSVIRNMRSEDIAGAVALQRACFPPPFPEELLWKAEHLVRHLELFPQGQFVADIDGQIVASASAVRISEDVWRAHLPWEDTVGGAFLNNQDPAGSTLYGVDISVHPAHRGAGLGRKLYEARFELVRSLFIDRYGTACRIPDYRNWAQGTAASSPDHSSQSHKDHVWQYAQEVAEGAVTDRTLTPLLRYGLHLVGVIHDYMEDEESGNAAALLEWKP